MKKTITILLTIMTLLGCSENYTELYQEQVVRINLIKEAYPNADAYHVKGRNFLIVEEGYLYKVVVWQAGIRSTQNLKKILIESDLIASFKERNLEYYGELYAISSDEGIIINNEKIYKYTANVYFIDELYELEKIQ